MKRLTTKRLKRAGILIFSILLAFVFITSGSALAQTGAAAGGAGLGAAGAIGPLGLAAIAAGTLAAVIVVAESTTDSDSTVSHHATPSHHGN